MTFVGVFPEPDQFDISQTPYLRLISFQVGCSVLMHKNKYGYGSVAELSEGPGIVGQAYRIHRSSGRVQNMLHPYPGYCGTGLTAGVYYYNFL